MAETSLTQAPKLGNITSAGFSPIGVGSVKFRPLGQFGVSANTPVNGTVQQLAVHTVGGVVTPAQPLMYLVPDGQPVEVEAMLENKDVGFVHAGQSVTVKIETFTFTKYGTVSGVVKSVSTDAIEDEKRGLIYSSKISLSTDHLVIDGHSTALSPGMGVSAEIKIDRRRIIEYFLSPLQKHMSESMTER